MASSSQETDETLEWEYARACLLNKSDGTKLRRTQSKIFSTAPRNEKSHKSKLPHEKLVKNSYIKFGDTVYRIGAKIGEGTYGKVRCLTTESGETYVVKISSYNFQPTEVRVARMQEYALREPASRISFYKGFEQVHKYYLPMRQLGVALDRHFRKLPGNNLDSRLDIAIKLCIAMHRLHHVHGFAHLDTRHQNATIEPNGTVHLIDYGASEPDPAGIAHNPMGSYIFRPPRSRRYTREELDSIALRRIIHLPAEFYVAGMPCDSLGSAIKCGRRDPLILLQDEHLKRFGLEDLFNDTCESVETAKARHQTPLYLAARLICAKYSLASLELDSFTCTLLACLYAHNKTLEEVNTAIANPDEWVREHLGSEAHFSDNSTVLRAKFICRSLEIKWNDTLTAHAETLYHLAMTPGFLLHLKTLAAEPLLLQRLSGERRPEILNAIKGLLDNIPSKDPLWRIARIHTFLDKPDIAPLNPAAESALSLSERYGLQFTAEELQSNESLALLINRLEAVGIAAKARDFLEFNDLIQAVIRDSSEHWLLCALADSNLGRVTFKEMLQMADFLVSKLPPDEGIARTLFKFLDREHIRGDLIDILDNLKRLDESSQPLCITALLALNFDEADEFVREASSFSSSSSPSSDDSCESTFTEHTVCSYQESIDFTELESCLRLLASKIDTLPEHHPKRRALTNWCDSVQTQIKNTRNREQSEADFVINVVELKTDEFLTTIGEHRGILGVLDATLRGIVAFVQLLICQCSVPQRGTFFKTESERLIDSAMECVNTLNPEI
ncbi:Protein kinase domain protein [Legionella geestiana]|uniref:Protein kinase domain protein n=1 Tax=Legionella geestiana TaxID=45065 RepID=A0A0W0TPI0_9GAMM|nr:serine/threonine-protein kinase [Legionella geestiana]KTC97434.1 Protein kinase domain protein [Legionella geestiana]STX54111.1 Protein kinase domain [Legionella geestiana]